MVGMVWTEPVIVLGHKDVKVYPHKCLKCRKDRQLLLGTNQFGAICKHCFEGLSRKAFNLKIKEISNDELFAFRGIAEELLESFPFEFVYAHARWRSSGANFINFMEFIKANGTTTFRTKSYRVTIATHDYDLNLYNYSFERLDGRPVFGADNPNGDKTWWFNVNTYEYRVPLYNGIFRALFQNKLKG